MELRKIQTSSRGIASLAELLRERFGVDEPIESLCAVVGGGANDQDHRVVETRSGRRFGIKTAPRAGGPQGERREAAFSEGCQRLGVPGACRAVCVDGIRGVKGCEARPSVVIEWAPDSKRLSELSDTERKELEPEIAHVMEQVGGWLAANLHLGLGDRAKRDNWAWCQATRRLTAIDAESAFGIARVQDHHSVIDAFYERRRLRAERGVSPAGIGFERGLRRVHARVREDPAVIRDTAGSVESCRSYVSPYAGVSEDDFADRVFSELA